MEVDKTVGGLCLWFFCVQKRRDIMISNKLYFLGKAGSGKNYVIDIIKKAEPDYETIKIAEPIYRVIELIKRDCIVDSSMAIEKLGFSKKTARNIIIDILENIDYNSLYLDKPRQPLQVAGDVIRSYNKDILIEYAYKQTIDKKKVIVEDVRLKAEADYFNDRGFIGIKVCASDKVREKRLKARDKDFNSEEMKHKTETEIDLIDNVVHVFNDYNTSEKEIIWQLQAIEKAFKKELNSGMMIAQSV